MSKKTWVMLTIILLCGLLALAIIALRGDNSTSIYLRTRKALITEISEKRYPISEGITRTAWTVRLQTLRGQRQITVFTLHDPHRSAGDTVRLSVTIK